MSVPGVLAAGHGGLSLEDDRCLARVELPACLRVPRVRLPSSVGKHSTGRSAQVRPRLLLGPHRPRLLHSLHPAPPQAKSTRPEPARKPRSTAMTFSVRSATGPSRTSVGLHDTSCGLDAPGSEDIGKTDEGPCLPRPSPPMRDSVEVDVRALPGPVATSDGAARTPGVGSRSTASRQVEP